MFIDTLTGRPLRTDPTRHIRPALTSIVLSAAVAAGMAQAAGPVVRTDAGLVQGLTRAQGQAFLGIPFAAAPVGSLRWRAPQPVASWNGVRSAQVPGATCIQDPSRPPAGVGNNSEDCLYLNVHVPTNATTGKPMPVMVWIHGGAFLNGAGSKYDGGDLASRTQSIVVTLNYRLGVFGFLALDALTAEDPAGNPGLQDQQAALRWVRRNIASFGGNPSNVTIFGESAGGTSVCNQLMSPRAAGLFHRAIIQSGSCPAPQATRAEAAANGQVYADKLGCPSDAGQLACLRAKSTQEAFAAAPNIELTDPASLKVFYPHVDGVVLPVQPREAFRTGRFNKVPVMVGANSDEGTLFVALAYELSRGQPLTDAEFDALVKRMAGDGAFASLASSVVLGLYNSDRQGSANLAAAALLGDRGYSCPTQALARALSDHVPTYAYEFQEKAIPPLYPDPFMPWGAYHASELPFLFGKGIDITLNGSSPQDLFTPTQFALSRQMTTYWGRFAEVGQPNPAKQPVWPRFNRLLQSTQTLRSQGVGTDVLGGIQRRHQCPFWDTVGALGLSL